MKSVLSKLLVWLLTMTLGTSGIALAAPIAPDTLFELDRRDELLSRIHAQTAREEVRTQFLANGVAPAEVDARIAALSTEELELLAAELDELPAGGSVLGLIGAVFLVLLILEVLGVTNVFTAV